MFLERRYLKKEDSDQPGNGLIFKGLFPRSSGRISGHEPEKAFQTLKNKIIGNRAYRYRLERISRGLVSYRLPVGVLRFCRPFQDDI